MVIRLGNNAETGKLYVGNDEVQKVFLGGVEVWPGGAVGAPVLSALSWNNAAITLGLTVNESCSLIMCKHATSETPIADGNGGWSHVTTENWSFPMVTSNSETLTINDETDGEISYYARDADGNDSPIYTETITFVPAGSFLDDFERPNELLAVSSNWNNLRGQLTVDGGNVRGTQDSTINSATYTGALNADAFVEVTINTVDGLQFIYLRTQDADNGYFIEIRADGNCRTYRRATGVNTEIFPRFSADPKEISDVYRAQIVGDIISISKNGGISTDVTMGGTYSTGTVGVGVFDTEPGLQSVILGNI